MSMKAMTIQVLFRDYMAKDEILEAIQVLVDTGAVYSAEFSYYEDVANPHTYEEKLPDRFQTRH